MTKVWSPPDSLAFAFAFDRLRHSITKAPKWPATQPGDDRAQSRNPSGFTGFPHDIAFGPDRRLYLSHFTVNRISRIQSPDVDCVFEDRFMD